MKRKPREPNQCYWLDLPTGEPLSFCQANSAPTSLPHMPDPTSPSLFPSFRLFLFLRHGCSNLVLRLGTHWAVAMVTGKLFGPCASKETFPLLEFPPSWVGHNEAPSPLPARRAAPAAGRCSGGREKRCCLQYTGCRHAQGCGGSTCTRPECSYMQPPCSSPTPVISEADDIYEDREILPSSAIGGGVFLFQYKIDSEKMLRICLKVVLLPLLQAWKSVGKDFVLVSLPGAAEGTLLLY